MQYYPNCSRPFSVSWMARGRLFSTTSLSATGPVRYGTREEQLVY